MNLPDTTILETKRGEIVAQAQDMRIETATQYEGAGAFLRAIKGLREQVKITFADAKLAAHKAHKAILAAEAKHDEPLADAESLVKRKVGVYLQAMDKIRQEREAELQAQARKLEEDRRISQASALEAEGKAAQASALLARPIVAPVVVVESEVPEVKGVSSIERWTFRITNITEIPREFLVADEKRIGQVVRAMRGETRIPGVEAFREDSISVRK